MDDHTAYDVCGQESLALRLSLIASANCVIIVCKGPEAEAL
jgi:hypothetical protein